MNNLKNIVNNNKQLLGNIAGAFLVKGGSLIISVLMLPAYINFFENQVVLGIWYTILSVLNWVILFDLGLGQGLRNQLPEAIEEKDSKKIRECISTTYIIMTAVAAAIMILGIILIPYANWNSIFNIGADIVSNDILIKCVIIVFCGIMVQIVLKIVTSILYALQKSAIVNALGLVSNILIYLSLLIVPSKDISSNLITMSWINIIATNLPLVICTIILFMGKLKNEYPKISAFSKKYVKDIFNVGISLLWLQVVFMVVSSTNEILIANFTSPEYVVEYQAYFKIFKTVAMIVSLALTPVWSAVTKAKVQKNYNWIIKAYKIFLLSSAGCFVLELLIIPFLQFGFNIWLGKGVIDVNVFYAIVFVLSSIIFVLHNVNTTIGNGLSYFRLQMIWMTFAALAFVPAAYILVKISGSWIGVVGANVAVMLPYEVLAPLYTKRFIKNLEKADIN